MTDHLFDEAMDALAVGDLMDPCAPYVPLTGMGACQYCGAAFPLSPRGAPPRKWCSTACKKRYHRRASPTCSPCTECGTACPLKDRLCQACDRDRVHRTRVRVDPNGISMPVYRRDGFIVGWVALDTDDAHLARHRWYMNRGYVARRLRRYEGVAGQCVFLHREVLGLAPSDKRKGDHIDGDVLNNRRSNLRVATNAENSQNVPGRSGTSRFRGVYLDGRSQRWVATVRNKRVGTFDTEEKAAAAAAAKRVEVFTHANEDRAGGWQEDLNPTRERTRQ